MVFNLKRRQRVRGRWLRQPSLAVTLMGHTSPQVHPELPLTDPELIKLWGRKDELIIQVPAYSFLVDLWIASEGDQFR